MRVEIKDSESFDQLLRRFQKGIERSGIIREHRRGLRFISGSSEGLGATSGLAGWPAGVRGFGHVKARSLVAATARRDDLLRRWREAVPAT